MQTAKQFIPTFSISHAFMLVVAAVLVGACGSGSNPDAAGGQWGNMPPQETDFIQLTNDSADVKTTYPGTIEGSVNVDIKAQVTGYLETIFVKEGDYVQKGQSLFRIKGDVYQEQVNNTGAALKAALAAQANAQLEIEKIKPLVEGNVLSDMQLKTAQASYDAATAQVAQARASLGSSQINAGFALIKAPVSGYIGRIPNRIGNLVTPGDETPLTTLSDINTVFVYFSMSEGDFIDYSARKQSNGGLANVELQMANGSTYAHKGTLEAASGNIDRNTGSMAMKAIFPNPDKLLRSGGAGRVLIHQQLSNVLKIPMGSVKDIQDKYFVYKLADSNKVAMTAIEIEGRANNQYLVKEGIKTGDKIAVDRIDALFEGMQVVPKMVAADSLAKY